MTRTTRPLAGWALPTERPKTTTQAPDPGTSKLLKRQFHRNGAISEATAQAGFLDVRRRFDFRSIEVGRWVTEAEKRRTGGLFYDALCDLMTILGGSEILISLRGSLALQYGTGGQRGVAAHYTPVTRTFSLAKNAGPGSIAHEWFHAFDHYIASKAFRHSGNIFASKAWLERCEPIAHPLNALLNDCFKAVLLDESGKRPSELFRNSSARDRQLGSCYYALPEELCARAFEAFVQDAPIKNQFLVAGTLKSEEAQLGLYPFGAQRERINAAFKAYFGTLGRALT